MTNYHIAFTGHRPHKLNNEYDGVGRYSDFLRVEIEKVINSLTGARYRTTFISGMALGFDMLVAETAIKHGIRVIAAIPCKGQTAKWPQKSVDRYNQILSNPLVEVHMVSKDGYTLWCMEDRNIWMVDHCHRLVAAFDGSPGGTRNCIEYAKKVLPPNKIQVIDIKVLRSSSIPTR